MSAINQIEILERQIRDADRWLALIGRQQKTTRPGVGHLFRATATAQIYFQEHDGSKNYHEMPDALRKEFSNVVHERFSELVNEAKEAMVAIRKELSIQAAEEYERKAEELRALHY